MNGFSDRLLYGVLIVALLITCILLFRRWGLLPRYRVEIPASRFARWWLTYVFPVGPALFGVFLVVLALADWFPRFLSFGISDPIALRIVSISIFTALYLWQVLGWRKLIREQESCSS